MKSDRDRIIAFMQSGAKRPVSIKEVFTRLKVPKEKRDACKRLVKDLAAEGVIVKIRGGRYGLPAKMNLVTGELTCHPDGFGFVIPEANGGENKGEDVYINRRNLAGAMHGDRVVARVETNKYGGKREGRIIRVLARARKRVVGTYRVHKGHASVVPSDERILDAIIIEPQKGGPAGHPGPGRGAAPGPEDGMIVEAEITRWPMKYTPPLGRVTEVLGFAEDPDVEIEVIVKKFGLQHRFPAGILNEVKSTPQEVRKADLGGRVDLRDVATVTIDGETAKDFDDAVSIKRRGTGYALRVSIADVSHYVKEGSALDAEAYARGTSVYFPDRCIPMLPEPLSNGICSLKPGVERLTVTAELIFDANGRETGVKFYESVIKSTARLTYIEVKNILVDRDTELIERHAPLVSDLRLMEELARKLMKRRAEEGSIDFDLPEPQILIDIEGRIEGILRSERNIAHRIIEEFMLAANRAAARRFSKSKEPSIYRVHEEPDAESINDFKEFVSNLGCPLPQKGKPGPKAFQRLLERVRGRAEERLVNHVLLRAMKKAEYSPENSGHFGLAFDDYTHFTSPIRRYPDLIVHRLLKKLMNKGYSKAERKRLPETLAEVARHTSERERNAMGAEREIVDLKKAQFMKDKEGEEFAGLVSGVTSFGFFVELEEYFVEGLVHVTTLRDDYYTFLEKEFRLLGETTGRSIRLGQEVSVLISRVDIARRRIDLELAGPRRSAGETAAERAPRAPKKSGQSAKKGKPAKPGRPAKPGQSAKPGRPARPARPAKSKRPAGPGQSAKPGRKRGRRHRS